MIWDVHPDPDLLSIPDPGVKKAPDPGFGSATLVEWSREGGGGGGTGG
jgi:hypothetical protein